MRTVVVVACGKAKRPDGPHRAQDLYTGSLFSAAKAYAEQAGDEWVILSARYGVLRPDDETFNYEARVADLDRDHRAAWERRVETRLRTLFDVSDTLFVVTAGAAYRGALRNLPHVSCPWDSLPAGCRGMGYQLQWLTNATRGAS